MDVKYFLNRKVNFIRQFYEMSSAPFVERKRQIEAEEEPYVPPYSEDPEPAFLEEWLEADESLQVVGRTCISMLAATFHLYFKTWERQTGIPVDASFKADFKNGWFNGYKAWLGFKRKRGVSFKRYEEAKVIVHKLGLGSYREWESYCRGEYPHKGKHYVQSL